MIITNESCQIGVSYRKKRRESGRTKGKREGKCLIKEKVRVLYRYDMFQRSVLQELFIKEATMYIKFLLLLKIVSVAIALPIYDNNMNGKIILPYTSNISTIHPIVSSKKAMDQLSDGNRIDFQIRNHQGPGTYIFGFDTGHGKNRQYKMEERLRDGSVKGRYGFYDAKGHLRIINYIASPVGGYQERHHETIAYKSET